MTHASLLLLLALVGCPAFASGQTIRYVLEPRASPEALQLQVVMSFLGDSSGTTRVELPGDRFGVSGMHRFIHDRVAGNSARIVSAADDSVVVLRHAPGQAVSLGYTVRYDSAAAGFVAFGPSVGPAHFTFLGSQWMARAGARDAVRQFIIQVARGSLPDSVPLAGSFGIGPGEYRQTGTYDELEWTVIAGGAFRWHRFSCRGQPVATLVRGSFVVPDDSLFAVAQAVICSQRDLFDDHSQPFYSVVISAREGIRAGASFVNAFACFVESDASSRRIAALLAHETMHAWLPRRIRLVPGPDEPAPRVNFSLFHDIRYDWFHEGFTEYLSRLVQVRAGLASQEWFVQELNADLARLAVHPYRRIPVADLEQAARDRRFTNFHQRLSYLRGTVLALRWDAALRRQSGGSRDLIGAVRHLLRVTRGTDGRIERPRFERAMDEFGLAVRGDIARYSVVGEEIPVDPRALGPEWTIRYRSVPAYEPGFDVVATSSADTVRGVVPGGAAHRAGLRNGMPVVRLENAWRWGDDWKADAPVTVVVAASGGERAISFRAPPGRIPVPEYVPAMSSRRAS